VKYYRDRTKGTVDFGNDLKSATTDALKKCASEFGLASDVFWKQETKEVQQVDKTYIPEVVKENKVAELLATEEEKKKIVDLTKDLGAKTPQATAKMVENIVKGNVDWNKMPKVLAGKVYAELLRKQINKK
jgi:recombination DNA repair RAD52 pathway protein